MGSGDKPGATGVLLQVTCPQPCPASCPLFAQGTPLPTGAIHLEFHSSGNHYVWRKVTSTVHNIIVGKLWIDQVGAPGLR